MAARLLKTWVAEPSACAYLPGRSASLEYKIMVDVDPDELDALLERGWRRFGPAYFRPRCAGCSECVPLRVRAQSFAPSRGQRRIWRRRTRFEARIGPPNIDDERIALYDAWHGERAQRRGWSPDAIDPVQYYHQFAFPHPSIRELTLRDRETGRLVAVGIVDETPRAMSAVYTFHHPDYRRFSLGSLVILEQIERAAQAGKAYVYLGYRVEGCQSSAYKAEYRPHETMRSWREMNEPPDWVCL